LTVVSTLHLKLLTVAMVIGVLELKLSVPWSNSLKDKRMVLQSAKECIRNKFNVSVAEVGAHDDQRTAIIGAAVISSDRAQAHRVLESVAKYVAQRGDAVLLDYGIEML